MSDDLPAPLLLQGPDWLLKSNSHDKTQADLRTSGSAGSKRQANLAATELWGLQAPRSSQPAVPPVVTYQHAVPLVYEHKSEQCVSYGQDLRSSRRDINS